MEKILTCAFERLDAIRIRLSSSATGSVRLAALRDGTSRGDSVLKVADILAALKEVAPAAFADAIKAHIPAPASAPIDDVFRVGDTVEALEDSRDIVRGNHYVLTGVDRDGDLRFKDDSGHLRIRAPHHYRKVTPVPSAAAPIAVQAIPTIGDRDRHSFEGRWSAGPLTAKLCGEHGTSKLSIEFGDDEVFIQNADLPKLKAFVEKAMELCARYPDRGGDKRDLLPAVVATPATASTDDDVIRVGDMIECIRRDIDLTVGKVYGPVFADSLDCLTVRDDAGDARDANYRFKKVRAASPAPTSTDDVIREGDMVECISGGMDLTAGKIYGPVLRFGSGLSVRDNVGDRRLATGGRFKKVRPAAPTAAVPPPASPTIQVGDTVEVIGGRSLGHCLKVGTTATVTRIGPTGNLDLRGTSRYGDEQLVQTLEPRDVRKVETFAVGDTVEVISNTTCVHFLKIGTQATVVEKISSTRVRARGICKNDGTPRTQFIDTVDIRKVSATAAPAPVSADDSTIRVGDFVRAKRRWADITEGRIYGPVYDNDGELTIRDDVGDAQEVDSDYEKVHLTVSPAPAKDYAPLITALEAATTAARALAPH